MNLKEIRKKNGLSQLEASKNLNITSDYLSMLENGKRTCSIKLVNSLAKLYKVPPEKIFLSINGTICTK